MGGRGRYIEREAAAASPRTWEDVVSDYQKVPPLGGDRALERQPDPWERRAQQQAAQLDQLERKGGSFGDYERFGVDAVLARPLSDDNRRRAQALKDRHGMPVVQRPLLAGVPGGQQQGQGSGQRSGSRAQLDADLEFGRQLAQQIRDAVRDALD